jgi:hypothetical protein
MTSKPLKLTSSQFKQLHDALLSAFPTVVSLKQMVRFELDENLDEIAGGQNLSEKVFNLIDWAEAQRRTEELIKGACNHNPSNPVLQQFMQEREVDISSGINSSTASHKQAKGHEESLPVQDYPECKSSCPLYTELDEKKQPVVSSMPFLVTPAEEQEREEKPAAYEEEQEEKEPSIPATPSTCIVCQENVPDHPPVGFEKNSEWVHRYLNEKKSVLVIGGKGAGKTTLLGQIREDLRNCPKIVDRRKFVIIYINVEEQENMRDFCEIILDHIDENNKNKSDATPENVCSKIKEVKNYKYIILLLDHVKIKFKGYENLDRCFARILATLPQERHLSLVIAVREREEIKHLPSYRHYKENLIKLKLLTKKQAKEMLKRFFENPHEDKLELALQAIHRNMPKRVRLKDFVVSQLQRNPPEIYNLRLLSNVARFIDSNCTCEQVIYNKKNLDDIINYLRDLEEEPNKRKNNSVKTEVGITSQKRPSSEITEKTVTIWDILISHFRSLRDLVMYISDNIIFLVIITTIIVLYARGESFIEIIETILQKLS